MANAMVRIETDCLFRSVRMKTQIERMFPNTPTQMMIGVKRRKIFWVNVPSNSSDSFNVQDVAILFLICFVYKKKKETSMAMKHKWATRRLTSRQEK